MFYRERGIKITFKYGRYEYSCECYSLDDVACFISDLSTDCMESGQTRFFMEGPQEYVPVMMFSESCSRSFDELPEVYVSRTESFHIEDEDT